MKGIFQHCCPKTEICVILLFKIKHSQLCLISLSPCQILVHKISTLLGFLVFGCCPLSKLMFSSSMKPKCEKREFSLYEAKYNIKQLNRVLNYFARSQSTELSEPFFEGRKEISQNKRGQQGLNR